MLSDVQILSVKAVSQWLHRLFFDNPLWKATPWMLPLCRCLLAFQVWSCLSVWILFWQPTPWPGCSSLENILFPYQLHCHQPGVSAEVPGTDYASLSGNSISLIHLFGFCLPATPFCLFQTISQAPANLCGSYAQDHLAATCGKVSLYPAKKRTLFWFSFSVP